MLKAGGALTWTGGLPAAPPPLKVHVTDANGRPVPNALLFVNALPYRVWFDPQNGFIEETPLPSPPVRVRDGVAELRNAPPGRLSLDLVSGRARRYRLIADVGSARTLDIRLPGEEQ